MAGRGCLRSTLGEASRFCGWRELVASTLKLRGDVRGDHRGGLSKLRGFVAGGRVRMPMQSRLRFMPP